MSTRYVYYKYKVTSSIGYKFSFNHQNSAHGQFIMDIGNSYKIIKFNEQPGFITVSGSSLTGGYVPPGTSSASIIPHPFAIPYGSAQTRSNSYIFYSSSGFFEEGSGYDSFIGANETYSKLITKYTISGQPTLLSSSSSLGGTQTSPPSSYIYMEVAIDDIDPYSISYDRTNVVAGDNINILLSPKTTNYGTIYYQYQYSINNGSTWTNIDSKTTATSISVTIPTNATQFKVRVLASDNLGFTSTTYVVGDNLTVQTSGGDNYIGIGGTARQIDKIYIGIGGTAREVTEGYIGIGGTARKFYG